MRRSGVAVVVALVVLLVGVAPASGGFSNPYLLRYIGVPEDFSFVDVGTAGESAGDTFFLREGLYRWVNGRQGPKAGRLQVQCTVLGRGGLVNCMATAFVPKGTIVLGGWIRADAKFTVPVLGGSGIYRGVGGVVKARDLSRDRTAYVFRLAR